MRNPWEMVRKIPYLNSHTLTQGKRQKGQQQWGPCLVNHKSPQTDYRWKSNHWKLAELVAARYCTLTELPLPRATHSTANMALRV